MRIDWELEFERGTMSLDLSEVEHLTTEKEVRAYIGDACHDEFERTSSIEITPNEVDVEAFIKAWKELTPAPDTD